LLERRGNLEREQVEGMLAWPHSGFSVHTTVHADPQAPEEMARLGRYLLHPPISLERLEYRGAGKPCTYTGRRPDPRTGAVSEDCDPLEFLARLCQHIPPPRTHLTRLYGAYSTRHRVARRNAPTGPVSVATAPGDHPAPNDPTEDHQPPPSPAERKRRADWGRLLAKVFEIDPFQCPCGGTRRIVAVILDPRVIRKILEHVRKLEARAPPHSTA
jgi:hypothetical protein